MHFYLLLFLVTKKLERIAVHSTIIAIIVTNNKWT
jgi:hypothetical protein